MQSTILDIFMFIKYSSTKLYLENIYIFSPDTNIVNPKVN